MYASPLVLLRGLGCNLIWALRYICVNLSLPTDKLKLTFFLDDIKLIFIWDFYAKNDALKTFQMIDQWSTNLTFSTYGSR